MSFVVWQTNLDIRLFNLHDEPMFNLKTLIAFVFFAVLIYGLQTGSIVTLPLILLSIFILLNNVQKKTQSLIFRNVLGFVIFVFGMLFALHLLGFHNIKLNTIQFSENGIPQTSYFNFDKILSSLILLYFYENKLSFSSELFKKTFLLTFVSIVVCVSIALLLRFVTFDFKIHETILTWSLRNFFAVALCEEILFRGVLQEMLASSFSSFFNSKWANFIGLLLSSILFGLFHYKSGFLMIGFATIAGIFYGLVYIKTNHIFYSTLAHFSLNWVHFVFFTYPCLM